jgi:hypothetical protein
MYAPSGHKLRIEQNPRCPPGGHLGFWAALVFESNFPLVDLNPSVSARGGYGGYNTPLEWPKIDNICYFDQEI